MSGFVVSRCSGFEHFRVGSERVRFRVVVVVLSWVYATPETISVFYGESFLGLCDREQLRRRSPFSWTGPGGGGSARFPTLADEAPTPSRLG